MRSQKLFQNSVFLLFLGIVPFIYSCKEEKKPKTVESTQTTTTTTSADKNNNAASSDVTLNPPHGQPGHRCDIKVGQPLNGTGQTLNTNGQQSPVIIDNSKAVPTSGSGSGTPNPPHGQPGHVCGVPVGSPL